MHAQRGGYALLLGSGVSSGVGVPTGWGVVEALVRMVATAGGKPIAPEQDWETWWRSNYPNTALGYSTLLAELEPTSAGRRALLARFFEPSEDERENGLKVPGPAHRAIAKLVANGTIRVIVTTNFDRLLEDALSAENVQPQVLVGDAAVQGREPLQHAKATILKLHGDYASLEQRNTVEELAEYPRATTKLLRRILDEYGLIVSGWSGEWDAALVAELERTANRRYPLYWSAYSEPGALALRLTGASSARIITGLSADLLFPDLLARVQALETLAEPSLSTAVKVQRLKKVLADPTRHIEVRDLLYKELDDLRVELRERPRSLDHEYEFGEEVNALSARVQPLLQLLAQGVALDRDRQHTALWVAIIADAMNARVIATGSETVGWAELAHYPALLVLRAGIMGAITAGHEDVVIELAGRPRWENRLSHRRGPLPAHDVLHYEAVLDEGELRQLFRGRPQGSHPASRLVRAHLRDVAVSLAGETGADVLLHRMEYRMALANRFLLPSDLDNYWVPGVPSGLYLADRERMRNQRMWVTDDFLRSDTAPWAEVIGGGFNDKINELDKDLRELANGMR